MPIDSIPSPLIAIVKLCFFDVVAVFAPLKTSWRLLQGFVKAVLQSQEPSLQYN